MKIVIPGGTGQVGRALIRALGSKHEIVVLTRRARPLDSARVVDWDGRSCGPWSSEIDGADVVINLAGRNVNCRYTEANLAGDARARGSIRRARSGRRSASAPRPPRVWLQMSTATIYAHPSTAQRRRDRSHRRQRAATSPRSGTSASRSHGWERAQPSRTPRTRKVALRAAMVMSPDRGGVFDTLSAMTRRGLGGAIAGGRQFVSWIHERDFVRAMSSDRARGLRGPGQPRRSSSAAAARVHASSAPASESRSVCPRRDGWSRSARSYCERRPNCS